MAMKTQDIIDLMGRFDTSGIGRMKTEGRLLCR